MKTKNEVAMEKFLTGYNCAQSVLYAYGPELGLDGETERMAREAGLTDIRLNPKKDYVAAMTDWNDPLYKKIVDHLPAGSGPGDYVTSLEVLGRKPVSRVRRA